MRFRCKTIFANILDLSLEWNYITPSTSALIVALDSLDALSKKANNIDKWTPDYLLPRLIMDCAKAAGYNGIQYHSVRGPGRNVVIFDPTTDFSIVKMPHIVNHVRILNPPKFPGRVKF